MLLTTVPILKLLINRAMEINIQINYLSSTILQIKIVEEHLVTFCVHPHNQTTILYRLCSVILPPLLCLRNLTKYQSCCTIHDYFSVLYSLIHSTCSLSRYCTLLGRLLILLASRSWAAILRICYVTVETSCTAASLSVTVQYKITGYMS